MSELEQGLLFLSEAFPTFSKGRISRVYESCGRNVEQAMDKLFQMNDESESESESEEDIKKSNSSIDNNEDEDMRIARELQAQFDAEFNIDSPVNMPNIENEDDKLSRELAMQLMQEDNINDEDLARQLQNQWNTPSTLSHNPQEDNIMNGLCLEKFLQSTISQEALDSLLDQIKTSIIPLLKEEALKLDLPGSEDEVEVPKFGAVQFGYSNISLESFDIPSEHLELTIQGNNIRAISKNIDARVKNFNWFFRQLKFPKLKDKGQAKASISSTTIDITLSLNITNTGTSLTVIDSIVKIGNLEAKVEKNAKRMLYNIVIGLVLRAMKPKLEELLGDLIRKGINEHSKELLGGF